MFEFSRDIKREELKIKNNVTLQWLCCNSFVAMASLQWLLLLPFASLYRKSVVYSTYSLIRMLLNLNFRYFEHIFKSLEFVLRSCFFMLFQKKEVSRESVVLLHRLKSHPNENQVDQHFAKKKKQA